MCDNFLAHPFAELPGSKRMKKSQDGNMNAGSFPTDMSKAQGLGSRTTRSVKIPEARENLNLPRRERIFGKNRTVEKKDPRKDDIRRDGVTPITDNTETSRICMPPPKPREMDEKIRSLQKPRRPLASCSSSIAGCTITVSMIVFQFQFLYTLLN